MNHNTHLYLYAKGHYRKTDLIEDLKTILSHRSNIHVGYITQSDISIVLLPLVWKSISNNEYRFAELLQDLAPENRWKYGARKDEEYWTTLYKKCLSILRYTKVACLDLGDPDPNILPLKEN